MGTTAIDSQMNIQVEGQGLCAVNHTLIHLKKTEQL